MTMCSIPDMEPCNTLRFWTVSSGSEKSKSFGILPHCIKKAAIQYTVCIYTLYTVFFPLAAHQSLPLSVRRIAEEAFTQKSYTATVAFFEKAVEKAASAGESCTLLQLLAGYEERHGNYTAAAARYRKAAAQAASFDTAQEHVLLLSAARAFLAAGSITDARSVLEKFNAYHSSGILSDHAAAAAVYKLWVLIAEGGLESALQSAKQYSTDAQFKAYHTALLFTLWWVDDDHTAAQRLRTEFPESPEAKAVQGELLVQPSPFWYLMPRSSKAVTAAVTEFAVLPHTAAQAGATAAAGKQSRQSDGQEQQEKKRKLPQPHSTQQKTGLAQPSDRQTAAGVEKSNQGQARSSSKKIRSYQIGFYKVHKYAAGLVEKLQHAGFEAYIREEPRPSGTVYFAVLVDEKPDFPADTIGEKLKNAGYQPFLLPD